MSIPTFPDKNICLQDAINLLLASIAYEELALAEIIKGESYKLKTALRFTCDPGELRDLNKSIESVLKITTTIETILQMKLRDVIEIISSSGLDIKEVKYCNNHNQYYYQTCPGVKPIENFINSDVELSSDRNCGNQPKTNCAPNSRFYKMTDSPIWNCLSQYNSVTIEPTSSLTRYYFKTQ